MRCASPPAKAMTRQRDYEDPHQTPPASPRSRLLQSISWRAMTFAASMTSAATVMGSALTYFQAVVLGVLQGVTELFPVSSLGHTVLFPTLFGWNELVHAQSQDESFWLAFVVMLHVGSALGLLFYYRRD